MIVIIFLLRIKKSSRLVLYSHFTHAFLFFNLRRTFYHDTHKYSLLVQSLCKNKTFKPPKSENKSQKNIFTTLVTCRMIVLLSGKRKSGKDFVAEKLQVSFFSPVFLWFNPFSRLSTLFLGQWELSDFLHLWKKHTHQSILELTTNNFW